MRILGRDKHDNTNSIVLTLFSKKDLSIEFKVKLYSSNGTTDQYYHTEYFYRGKDNRNHTIKLTPYSYIQISNRDSENKSVVILNEVYKNRVVREMGKLASLLDAYDAGKIDIVDVGSNGSYIKSNIEKVNMTIGKVQILMNAIFVDDGTGVSVYVNFDGIETVLSITEFLALFYRLKDVSFINMTVQLLSYYESPDVGEIMDFRSNIGAHEPQYDDVPKSSSYNSNPLKQITLEQNHTEYKRNNW